MKRNGKNAPLHADDRSRYDVMHSVMLQQRQVKANTVNAQDYTDNLKKAYDAYAASSKKIRENLEAAKEGLAAIDEKGMSDKIIEAINRISEIRQKQIAAASEYSTQIASYDSKRVGYIRENGDSRDRFVVDKFEEEVKARNAAFRNQIDEFDRTYREIETNLYRGDDGKHRDPTDEEMLDARRSQDEILEQKQRAMDEYAVFLQKTAVRRDEILNDWDSRAKVDPIKKSESTEITRDKMDRIRNAFDAADRTSRSKWDKFKSVPVVAHLMAGGVALGRKLAPGFDDFKADFLAGYAAMREHRQIRKAERALSSLDKIQGRNKDDGFLSKFKDSLTGNSTGLHEQEEKPEPIQVPEELVSSDKKPEEPAVSNQPDDKQGVSGQDVSEPVRQLPEDLHAERVRRAGNKAVLQAMSNTGLDKLVNDYYWSDVSQTHDIMQELSSSENVMTDLTRYVDRIKGMINHCPNETYRNAMITKLDAAMTETYTARTEYEKKVNAAEARIRDSEAFLNSLDRPASSEADIQKE